MDYVRSTYLISINCFRMLRLMNKKDSDLFGGPESETETETYISKRNLISIIEMYWISIKKYK